MNLQATANNIWINAHSEDQYENTNNWPLNVLINCDAELDVLKFSEMGAVSAKRTEDDTAL